ncbi:MAG: PQQ-binding-like beta-propeller repeat protein, partial [Planctomycetota bacterium]
TALVATLALPGPPPQDTPEGEWRSWRGPLGSGAALADPPIEWDAETNVAWTAALPGEGKSTPIVLGNSVFVLAAVPAREATPEELAERTTTEGLRTEAPDHFIAFLALAFDRKTGEALWESVLAERLPVTGNHSTNGYASFSPVTDGETLYAALGSYGVHAIDPKSGDVKWSHELGPQITRRGWGEAGSPAVHGDTLVVVADQEEASYIVALDVDDGTVRWRADRDEPSTWTTPVIVDAGGATQVLVNGTTAARSYDLASGEVLWSCGGQTVNAIPTPVTDGKMALFTSGYRGQACFAFDLSRRGDLASVEGGIAWQHSDGTPYVPSPVLVDGRVYMLSGLSGMLTCLDLASGELLLDRERLDLGKVYASPIAAAGRIYVIDRDGTAVVLQHTPGEPPKVLARNELGDPIDATPVAVGEALFVRSDSTLYAIGRP